jgi:glycosyltransferase involved in cell wall biosynthesis
MRGSGLLEKVDLVMWTKDGAATLPFVLKRIDEVIPSHFVSRRIIIDDRSIDQTREIAESFGWFIIFNEGKGISDGANTALKHVTSDCFISFEQDLLLAHDWWQKIPPSLENPRVAVASGMRFASKPVGVRKLEQYVAKNIEEKVRLNLGLGRAAEMRAFTLGKTLDNTIYRTKVIRAVKGFPKLRSSSDVDTILAYRVNQAGYYWLVDYSVQSTHLRQGLSQELNHQYWYGKQLNEICEKIKTETNQCPPITKFSVLYRFFFSMFTGLFIAFQTREPSITYIRPLIRFYYLKGFLESGK